VPELNDDFAKDLGLENIAELRKDIKQQFERINENEQLSSMRKQIVDNLLLNNQFDIPPSLLEMEQENLKSRFISDMKREGVSEPEIGEDLVPKFAEKATESLRTSIILSRIAKEENVKVTRKHINEHIEDLANSYNIPLDQVHKAYEQQGDIEQLNIESKLKTQRVLDLLLEKAEVEEVVPDPIQIDKE